MKTDLTAFEQMPDSARAWVYQSSRDFTAAELAAIRQMAREFLSTWDYHGTPLNAELDVLYDRFIVLMADDRTAAPGGCSIDRSIALLKEMEQRFGLQLLERMELAYLKEDGRIGAVHANGLSEAYAKGEVNGQSTVFNNMVTSFGQLRTEWRIPLSESWASARVRVPG